jgi:DNA-binding NtrC family response regulator
MVILVADDAPGIRNTLLQLLKKDHEVILCEDGEAALQVLEKRAVDLVITDHQMPKVSGIDVIRRGKEKAPGTAFLLMTAFGSIEQAVEAIRLGAEDYLLKPFDLSEIEHRIARIEDLKTWKAESALKEESATGSARLIGQSTALQRAREFIAKVAPVPSPVLLLGPSGSGKEVISKAIHESGPRAKRPFVAINCASLSEQLMESELFGHEKGAFTGAVAAKPGKFELAKGGTIFLDEIGEITPALQAKLLRVLQEKEFFRVGGVKQVMTDARVITATHRPLKEMVKQGTFREDLFFRLNVLSFELPPLAKRPEDIPPLIEFFWGRLTREFGKNLTLSPEALQVLHTYSYPGNVRELQNVLERLVVLGSESGSIDAGTLPLEFHSESRTQMAGAGGTPRELSSEKGLTEVLEECEARLVSQAMETTGHNQVKAAEILRITRGALQYKLKKYGFLKAA